MLGKLTTAISEVRVRICSIAAQYVGSIPQPRALPESHDGTNSHSFGTKSSGQSRADKSQERNTFGHLCTPNDVVRWRVAQAISYSTVLAVGLQISNWWDRRCAQAATGLSRKSVVDSSYSLSSTSNTLSLTDGSVGYSTQTPSELPEISLDIKEIATQTEVQPDFTLNFVAVMHNVIGLDMIRKKLYPEAAGHFKKASQLGYAPAQYNLAQCYLKGLGTQLSLEEAKHWWQLASDHGQHKMAQHQLSVYHDNQSELNSAV